MDGVNDDLFVRSHALTVARHMCVGLRIVLYGVLGASIASSAQAAQAKAPFKLRSEQALHRLLRPGDVESM